VPPTIEQVTITASTGLCFVAWVCGPATGEPVLLLHGFPQSRHAWRHQLAALGDQGFRAVAPDQRGYSAGARPDPTDLSNYGFDLLVADALSIAEACGWGSRPFHLVGHDWGGQVSWGVASVRPERLCSLTVLSRPHPSAFTAALAAPESDQKHRSRHHRAFLNDDTCGLLLADDAARLRHMLEGSGVPPDTVADYLSVLGTPAALESALAWYRASPNLAARIGVIEVPTMYVWGDADQTVGRSAADLTGAFVSAPYRFEILPGIGHFASDEAPAEVSDLLIDHVSSQSGQR
jgi:pimeloyl-ACP methyl ester carboxylesterase